MCERGGGEFEEVAGYGVGDDHLTRLRADEFADLVADALRRVPPAFVPAADEVVAPLFFDNLFCSLLRDFGHHAQRVAVEVDEVGVGDDEALAVGGEGVEGVEFLGEGEGGGKGGHGVHCKG